MGLWLEALAACAENPTVGLSVDLGGAAVLKIADGSQVALAAQLIRALRLPC
jgi:hypothetical protein